MAGERTVNVLFAGSATTSETSPYQHATTNNRAQSRQAAAAGSVNDPPFRSAAAMRISQGGGVSVEGIQFLVSSPRTIVPCPRLSADTIVIGSTVPAGRPQLPSASVRPAAVELVVPLPGSVQ